MNAKTIHEGSALTVTGNPTKDREESEEIMDGLLGLNGNDGTMEGDWLTKVLRSLTIGILSIQSLEVRTEG
jgi:hypothetical protein